MNRPAVALAVAVALAGLGVAAAEIPEDANQQIAAGKALFDTTCTGMCHGPGGRGGQAPALNRAIPLDRIATAIENGRPGTPMLGFRAVLSPPDLAAVIDYVSSLSSSGGPTASVSAQSSTTGPSAPGRPSAIVKPWLTSSASSQPVDLGAAGRGVPADGVVVFFDSSKTTSCRSCHSFRGTGGPISPDLADLGRTPQEVLRALSTPRLASAAFPGLSMRFKDGRTVIGVKRDESPAAVRYYDLTLQPPVARRVRMEEVAEVKPLAGGVYDHTKLPLTRQQRLDVSAMVGKAQP